MLGVSGSSLLPPRDRSWHQELALGHEPKHSNMTYGCLNHRVNYPTPCFASDVARLESRAIISFQEPCCPASLTESVPVPELSGCGLSLWRGVHDHCCPQGTREWPSGSLLVGKGLVAASNGRIRSGFGDDNMTKRHLRCQGHSHEQSIFSLIVADKKEPFHSCVCFEETPFTSILEQDNSD